MGEKDPEHARFVLGDAQMLVDLRGLRRSHDYARHRVSAARPGSASWLRLLAGRVRARRAWRQAQAQADLIDWIPVAKLLVHEALARTGSVQEQYNLYSLWTLRRLGSIAARITSTLTTAHLAQTWEMHASGRDIRLSECAQLFALCSDRSWVASVIAERVFDLYSVARDPEIIDYTDPGTGRMTIQHRATGLRVQFLPDQSGLGIVGAKAYRIESIDPENPGHLLDWERWTGYGVGTRLYRCGAALIPSQRWMLSNTSASARAVRRKLHAAMPYTWESDCGWCRHHLPDWKTASRAAFSNHP